MIAFHSEKTTDPCGMFFHHHKVLREIEINFLAILVAVVMLFKAHVELSECFYSLFDIKNNQFGIDFSNSIQCNTVKMMFVFVCDTTPSTIRS